MKRRCCARHSSDQVSARRPSTLSAHRLPACDRLSIRRCTQRLEKNRPYTRKSQNSTRLVTSRLYTTRNDTFDVLNSSSSSCRACRAVLFDKLDTAKMHGLDTSNVSCVVSRRDVTSQVEFGLNSATTLSYLDRSALLFLVVFPYPATGSRSPRIH